MGTLTVYKLATHEVINAVSMPHVLHNFVFSHDLRFVAGNALNADEQSFLQIWSLETGQRQQVLNQRGIAAFSRDNKRLISLDYLFTTQANRHSDVFNIWDVTTGAQLLTRTYYGGGGAHTIRFLPGQDKVVKLGYAGLPQSWDGTPVDVD